MDRPKANAGRAGGIPPVESNEADLRSLSTPPQTLRLQILPPTSPPIDANTVQLPMTLRTVMQDGAVRRYSGWYRLNRAPESDDWRIAAATIDALPAQE